MLNQYAGGGWDLVAYQTMHVVVRSHWLLALLGHKPETQFFDVAIFSKEERA